jgi:hypothetical protein
MKSALPADLLAITGELSEEKRFRIRGVVIRKDSGDQIEWVALVRGNTVLPEACIRESGDRTADA